MRIVAIAIAGSGRVGTIAIQECDRRAAGAVPRNHVPSLGELASPVSANAGDIPTSALWASARPGVAIAATRSVRSGPDAWNHAKAPVPSAAVWTGSFGPVRERSRASATFVSTPSSRLPKAGSSLSGKHLPNRARAFAWFRTQSRAELMSSVETASARRARSARETSPVIVSTHDISVYQSDDRRAPRHLFRRGRPRSPCAPPFSLGTSRRHQSWVGDRIPAGPDYSAGRHRMRGRALIVIEVRRVERDWQCLGVIHSGLWSALGVP